MGDGDNKPLYFQLDLTVTSFSDACQIKFNAIFYRP